MNSRRLCDCGSHSSSLEGASELLCCFLMGSGPGAQLGQPLDTAARKMQSRGTRGGDRGQGNGLQLEVEENSFDGSQES